MDKRLLVLILSSLLLSGCWDELLFKDVTIVPLAGMEGGDDDVHMTFAFPVFDGNQIKFSTSKGKGNSMKEAQMNANYSTKEALNLSKMEVLLVSEEMARDNLYQYLDNVYRAPRNRLQSYMALVEGDIQTYFNPSGDLQGEVSNYYTELLLTGKIYTYFPPANLQRAGTLLLENTQDLALPYLRIDEEGLPQLVGVGLFSGKDFTGYVLERREAMLATLLSGEKGKFTRFSYKLENDEKENELTFDVLKVKDNWDILNDRIIIRMKLKATMEAFPDYHHNTQAVEKQLSEKLTKDFNDVVGKMQEAKSDMIGLGRKVQAFHPEIWNRGRWQDTFSELPITVEAELTFRDLGILE
ncbi:Ger(x)C family spore germination protein [Sporosarcina newyorkensis]|uniref:Ger(x)C family spore germination protein n=1 Tax=Sporosarcina newyorkensis TaxID=759851 RepID=UPI003D017078